MRVIAIDPGPTRSAIVEFDGTIVSLCDILENGALRDEIRARRHARRLGTGFGSILAIEKIEAMGMAVGSETFETVYWSGRFDEAYGGEPHVARVTRREVKLHLCGSMRAKDPHIRQALIDRFGGDSVAKGTKRAPGPLYGVKSHGWAALAVAVVWWETKR